MTSSWKNLEILEESFPSVKLIQHKKVFKRTFKQGHKMIFNSKDENDKKANIHLLMFLKIQRQYFRL